MTYKKLPDDGSNVILAQVQHLGETLLIGPDGEGDWHMSSILVGGTERVEPDEIISFTLIYTAGEAA